MNHAVLLLNEAAKLLQGKLTLRWVKAHIEGDQYRGNHFADANARQGAEAWDRESLLWDFEVPERPFASIKTELQEIMLKQWDRRWKQNIFKEAKAEATKLWFPSIDLKKAFTLIKNSNRVQYSILMQAITGFNHLRAHSSKVDLNKNIGPNCNICKQEYAMTAEHILTRCDAFGLLRLHIFGREDPKLNNLTPRQLARFLDEANIGWLPGDPEV